MENVSEKLNEKGSEEFSALDSYMLQIPRCLVHADKPHLFIFTYLTNVVTIFKEEKLKMCFCLLMEELSQNMFLLPFF